MFLWVKGITQTQECSEQVNFDNIKNLVAGYLGKREDNAIETSQHNIQAQ